MTLPVLATYAAAVALLIGSGFVMVGVLGLLKFNDPMTRLHAPTKVGTVGIGMLLFASILAAAASGEMAIHELLIMAFLFLTAPISANFIAKVCMHLDECAPPPKPSEDEVWSTLATPDAAPDKE